jgi:hypothetical protein
MLSLTLTPARRRIGAIRCLVTPCLYSRVLHAILPEVAIMSSHILKLVLCLTLCAGAGAANLPTAPSDELLKVYAQLRAFQGSEQWAITENVEWQRDAATFTFVDGHLSFAEPVAGRVLAAYFEGSGRIRLKPPTPALQHQIARFAGGPILEDEFKQAVFFFTDDSWGQLQKLMKIRPGANIQAATQAFEAAQRKYSHNFNGWWENQRRDNPVMRNLAARMLSDLTDPSSKGFFLADFKGHRLGDLLYQISWDRDSLLLPDSSNDEEVMLIHYNRDQYSEWWAGFHRAEEYASTPWPEHRTLLAHCRQENIDAEVAKNNRLSATANMEFEVPQATARVLPLSLGGVLRISSIQDAQGNKLAFIQEARDLDSDPWVILPEPAAAGKVYTMKIAYDEDSTGDSRIVHQRGSGLYYVTERESWFPSFGAFDDHTRYSLHFLSPKKFKFVGTGRLVKSSKDKEGLETDWDSDVPFSVVGFNYGDFVEKSQSDADLTVTAYGGKEIPDELKGLQSAIDMAELQSGIGGERNLAGKLGIAEGGFNTAANTAYAAGVSLQALELYEYYFGKLPFKTVAVTEQPIRGYGQSWPTLIFLPYDSLLDSTTRHQLHLQDTAEGVEFYNVVAVHEMAHQWWGHTVGWKTYRDQWMSEGFAEFSAALYLRKYQPQRFRPFWDLKRKWLLSKNPEGHRPVDVGPLYLNYQLNAHLEPSNSTYLIYYKGAYVLEMLRAILEDPRQPEPDSRFIAMMRDFVVSYAGRNASTADFQRIVEKYTREPMNWFFNEWVYGTETPEYDFTYALRPGDGDKTLLQLSLTQKGVSDQFESRVPVYATAGGTLRRLGLIRIKGSTTAKGEVSLPFHPDKVTLDEYHDFLGIEHQ